MNMNNVMDLCLMLENHLDIGRHVNMLFDILRYSIHLETWRLEGLVREIHKIHNLG